MINRRTFCGSALLAQFLPFLFSKKEETGNSDNLPVVEVDETGGITNLPTLLNNAVLHKDSEDVEHFNKVMGTKEDYLYANQLYAKVYTEHPVCVYQDGWEKAATGEIVLTTPDVDYTYRPISFIITNKTKLFHIIKSNKFHKQVHNGTTRLS